MKAHWFVSGKAFVEMARASEQTFLQYSPGIETHIHERKPTAFPMYVLLEGLEELQEDDNETVLVLDADVIARKPVFPLATGSLRSGNEMDDSVFRHNEWSSLCRELRLPLAPIANDGVILSPWKLLREVLPAWKEYHAFLDNYNRVVPRCGRGEFHHRRMLSFSLALAEMRTPYMPFSSKQLARYWRGEKDGFMVHTASMLFKKAYSELTRPCKDVKMRWEVALSLLTERKPVRGVEIGVWKGEFSGALLKGLPSLEMLYCVDPFQSYEEYRRTGDPYSSEKCLKRARATFLERMLPYNGRYCLLEKMSKEAVKEVEEEVDFVFVDGNHSYNFVRDDILGWWGILREGGLMMGHDYTESRGRLQGVKRAVDELFGRSVLKGPDCTWWVWKRGESSWKRCRPSLVSVPRTGGSGCSGM